MNNRFLHFSLITLSSFVLFMLINVMVSNAQTETTTKIDYSGDLVGFLNNFCDFGEEGLDAMTVDDIRTVYLKATNDFLNANIKKLMLNEAKEAGKKADSSNENTEFTLGMAPTIEEAQGDSKLKSACPEGDYGCSMLYLCNKDRSQNPQWFNYSTYCVAQNALGFSPQSAGKMQNLIKDPNLSHLKKSYFCYKAALEYKVSGRGGLQETLGTSIENKCDTNSETKDEEICKVKAERDKETDPKKKEALQSQLDQLKRAKGFSKDVFALTDSVNERIQEINDETSRAKRALDQTLSAYNQLQTAWKMHVRYVEIFNLLVKYRDNIVEVRKQTDAFPLKFIDATTTRCL